MAIKHFVSSSVIQGYDPPYVYLMIIRIEDVDFANVNATEMKLDGFDAVNISEDRLISFNNIAKFVNQEPL